MGTLEGMNYGNFRDNFQDTCYGSFRGNFLSTFDRNFYGILQGALEEMH